jgi:hypothetical protein
MVMAAASAVRSRAKARAILREEEADWAPLLAQSPRKVE